MSTTLHTQKNPGTLISDNAGHQVWCNTFKVDALPDTYCVEMYSVYKDAVQPDEQRSIATLMLSQAQLSVFQASLGGPHASV